MKRILTFLLALGLVSGACSQEPAETTTTTVAPTTSTSPTTTTTGPTSPINGPTSPINGLPVEDETLLARRAITVKIDNHWNARPQSGIDLADAVIELRVEGGLTRFMAVFHSADAEYLGPIRSGRPADAKVVRPLDSTLFISGAQPWVQAEIRELGVPFFVDTRPGMFRIGSRFAPHNLYGNTLDLRGVADGADVPDTAPSSGLWGFGELPATATAAASVDVKFSNDFRATWTWSEDRWLRTINGGEISNTIDQEGVETQIWAETLVMIVGDFYTASPPAGSSGSPVPSTETVGQGTVYVFADGKMVEGTWSRDTATDPFTLTTADGAELKVPAGRVWISIVPDVGTVTWE